MIARVPEQPDPLVRVLEVLPHVELTVRSTSMLPFVPGGSRLSCRGPRAGEDLRHRIIIARDGERRLAHRVVKAWTDEDGVRWVRMRGDNSAGCEDVRQRDVIAVVDAVVVGGVRVPLHRLPARLEGALAWMGRQVVFFPKRLHRLQSRVFAA